MPTNVSRPPYMPQLSSLGSVPFISMHIEYKPIAIYSSNTAAISTKYRKQHHQDGALPYRLFYITRTLSRLYNPEIHSMHPNECLPRDLYSPNACPKDLA
ncbi:Uncharacterized protein HZ326_15531 [Fusarium oxysporum f. sp. albedinis]|nr:Uncharacterized protein HZ326_15531 [Fusarium oxysporum f. sp. albedinis]